MEDWDVNLLYAIDAAQKAAAAPLARVMLDICSCDIELPFSKSPKAMARLLDIAILTGNQKAAVDLSKKCQLRPLRGWGMGRNFEDCSQAAMNALLWAGADFRGLVVKDFDHSGQDVPFLQAFFLNSKLEDWQEIRHLLPQCHEVWRPRNCDNWLGEFFLEHPHGADDGFKLSLGKICAAEDAGVAVQFCSVGVFWNLYTDEVYLGQFFCQSYGADPSDSVSLLDMAIWCGQPDCAEACVGEGIELKDDGRTLAFHKEVLGGENRTLALLVALFLDCDHIHVVPFEAQTVAVAAGHAWLKRSWKRECSQKGIVLYQMMLKMFKGRSFPMALVQGLLAFSMPVPKIIDQLDLWGHAGDWMARGPFAPAGADVDGMDVKVESARMEGPCASDGLQQCTTTSTVGSWIVYEFSIMQFI